MSEARPLYSVRFLVHGPRSMPGVWDEEIVTDCDPFVLARRVLKLDAMREEGAGFSRADIFRVNVWPEGASFIRTVRVSKKLLDRFSIHGAIRRGVRNRGLRKLCHDHHIPYPG
jgi:hypothetical protein